jgi:hypothetical protein
MQDINHNRLRFNRFLKIIARYNTLVDVVFENLNEPLNLTASVIQFINPRVPGTPQYLNTTTLVKEVLFGILESMMMFIWQVQQKPEKDDEADRIQEARMLDIAKLVISNNNDRDSTGQIFSHFDRDLNSPYRDQVFGVILLDIILVRLQKMSTTCLWMADQPVPQGVTNIQMIISYPSVSSQINALKQEIKEFEYQNDIKQWWWFSAAVKIMGVLYAFLIPPAYFAQLGKNIIYVGPFMFMFLGGLVLINICLGDPFLHPTNKQMSYVYIYIHDIAHKIQRKFSARFISEIQTNTNILTGTTNNKQIAALQQRLASFELQSIDKQSFEKTINEWFSNADTSLSSTKQI